MDISPTTRIVPFDLDGNELAIHYGYDFNHTDLVFAGYPLAVGVTLTSRTGIVRIVRR